MSLLSDTQGRVDRVRSLVRLLEAHNGEMPREEVRRWLQPSAFEVSSDSVVLTQTIGAARSLSLVSAEAGGDRAVRLAESVPTAWPDFLDHVHARLAGDACDPKDEVMLRAYAYIVIRTEQEQGQTAWLDKRVDGITGPLDEALRPAGETQAIFNTSKWAAWKDWMVALGLAADANSLPTFYPDAAARMAREVKVLANTLGVGREIPIAAFWEALSQRLPYLDGGRIFMEVAARLQFRPDARPLTAVSSHALRDLHDEGLLTLQDHQDSPNRQRLFADNIRGFDVVTTVTLRKG